MKKRLAPAPSSRGCKVGCEIDVSDDYGSPSAFNAVDRKARKQHQCGECLRTIEKGETYRYESGIWEYGPDSHKTCMDCISVRDTFFCSFIFGRLWEDMHELVLDYDGELSERKIKKLTPAAIEMVGDIINALEDS